MSRCVHGVSHLVDFLFFIWLLLLYSSPAGHKSRKVKVFCSGCIGQGILLEKGGKHYQSKPAHADQYGLPSLPQVFGF